MTVIDAARARWITAPGADPQNPLLRTRFELPAAPVSARLLVTGLGVFRAFVNGAPSSASRLDPGLTDARSRVLVCDHDVTALLHPGENVLGIALGRGFHAMTTPNEWRWDLAPWRGPVRAWAQLRIEFAEHPALEIATDESWATAPGPITHDSMYEGETFAPREDPEAWLRAGYDASTWRRAVLATDLPPRAVLRPQRHEPVTVAAEIIPQVVSRTAHRVVLDMGRVIAGWCRFELADGAEPLGFRAIHGEKLRPDGSVDVATPHIWTGRFQEDHVHLDPALAPRFEPQFSYRGFRYVQLETLQSGGLASLRVTGLHAHAELTPASTLTSSNRFLEQFDRAMRASLANNMHHVPTDTPMHEKNGWTGDALTALPAMTTAFDMRRLLRKWLDDQLDGQREDGSLSVIAPNPDWGYEELSPAPEWTTLLPVLLDDLAAEYGLDEVVLDHGAAAARYVYHELSRRDEEGLISSVLGDYLSPGTPGPAREDRRLTGTLFVARALRALARAAERAGLEQAPVQQLRDEAAALEAAVNRRFLDPEQGMYLDAPGAEYRQTSNALALESGIVPAELVDAVAANLAAQVRERGAHHDCGHIGVRFLLPALSRHGYGDLALRVLENPTAPGWRTWLEVGNATFMEMWESPRSCSHYFMGTPVTWIHEHVVGLRRGADGWHEFEVAPDLTVDVERIAMTRETIHGPISVEVDRAEHRLVLTVPVGSRAVVRLPSGDHPVGPGTSIVTW